jgi:hypothetical protein
VRELLMTMPLVGKAERVQGAHGHHQTNRDRGSEMKTWRQFRVMEKKQARARSLPVRQPVGVLEIAA